MAMNDTLANALSKIMNSEKIGRKTVKIAPAARLVKEVLKEMNEHAYIGDFKEIEDGKGNVLELNLLGAINKCGAIKPRFPVSVKEYTKFEKRYLPAKDFGIMIVSTSKGIMTHIEAKSQNLGGKLIAYCY